MTGYFDHVRRVIKEVPGPWTFRFVSGDTFLTYTNIRPTRQTHLCGERNNGVGGIFGERNMEKTIIEAWKVDKGHCAACDGWAPATDYICGKCREAASV